MKDILTDLQSIRRTGGATYSSAEVLGIVCRAGAEIERLRKRIADLEDQLLRALGEKLPVGRKTG
jgi:hypothetical protein